MGSGAAWEAGVRGRQGWSGGGMLGSPASGASGQAGLRAFTDLLRLGGGGVCRVAV